MQTDRFSTYQNQGTDASAIRKTAWDVFESQRSKGGDSPTHQDSQAPDDDDVGTLECFYD